MLAAALRAGAFVFAAYATGRVLSRRARAGDERRIEQLRRECGTDMLTGLLNRRGGQEKAETMLGHVPPLRKADGCSDGGYRPF